MKRFFLTLTLLGGVLASSALAQPAEEARLIQVLQSAASPAEKEDACRRLKQIGTTQCIPVVAVLLTDEHLSQSACDVLETLPTDEANKVLLEALTKARGKSQMTVIHTLGERRYQPATAELARLLDHSDLRLSTSAARALGRIGNSDAAQSLRQKLPATAKPLRDAMVDALLDCAGQFLKSGDRAVAQAIYAQFNAASEKEQVRVAAYAGLIKAAESGRTLELVMTGLTSSDVAQQAAALRLAVTVQDAKATAAFTHLLTKAVPPLQVALLRLLQQRGDVSAAPTVFTQAQNPDASVRVAAITALGKLGDMTSVALLANAATSQDEAEQKAARLALTELRRGNVAEAMIAQLPTANPGVQVELIRALTARMDKTSAPKLLELASTGTPAAQRSALRGLEQLADASHVPALVKLLEAAKDESSRANIQSVFEVLADRTPPGEKVNVSAIVQGLKSTNVTTRVALLQVGAFFADSKLRDAFRVALKDANPQVRSAAERAVCNSRDAKLMPELLELAKNAPEINVRALALEGYVRLVGENDAGFPTPRRVQMLRSAYDLASRAEEKRLVLAALSAAPNLESLQVVEASLNDNGVKAESEVAIVRIAKALLPAEPTAATRVLRLLGESGSTPTVQAGARSTLKQFDSGWLYAGPHGRKGLEAMALFDVEFGPERGREVEWRRAPGTADLARPGEVDLLSVANREQGVMYLKTRVFVPVAQEVLFEIGSDDGIKLWLNEKLIHANNTIRGLTPGEDKLKATLHEGWNELSAKVTQSTTGWGMMLNIKNPDGSEVPGLRFDPRAETPATGFKRIKLADEFFAEGAYYGDFNCDGNLDIVAGPFWFAGPDFKQKHEYRPAKPFDPHGYSDNFLTYTADFNADGWLDIFNVPFPGAEGFWYENPQGKTGPWARYLAYPMVGNESPGWADMNGDGREDLIFNNEGFLGYATYNPAKPNEPWTFHAVSPKDGRFQRFTHGIGAGDINSDGKMDLVEAAGWWEQPVAGSTTQPWTFHAHKFAEAAAQMLVADVDGDGLVDVICSWHCHLYGLVWHRQLRETGGGIKWEQNIILLPTPDLRLEGVRFSQSHAMELTDMNGDGLKDIVTGKRFWAHGPAGDVEPDAAAEVYWFELKRRQGKATFVPHLIDADSGVGTQVTVVDLDKDQWRDVVVANKKGIFLHLNKLAKPTANN